MELMMALKTLSDGTATYRALRSFVQDELSDFLEQLGDIHFRSAVEALEDTHKSANPEAYVREAVTHLRSAANHFATTADRIGAGFGGFMKAAAADFVTVGLWDLDRGYEKRKVALYRKVFASKAITAVCLKYLREEKLLKKQIEDMKEYFYETYGRNRLPFSEEDTIPGKPDLFQEEQWFRSLCINLGAKQWPPYQWYAGGGGDVPVNVFRGLGA